MLVSNYCKMIKMLMEVQVRPSSMENLLNTEEIDWLIKFLSGKGSNDEVIEKIVRITTKLEKMKRR